MIEKFVPFEVKDGDKPGIWQMDISNLSTLELIKLREKLKDTTFNPTITMLDKLIYTGTDSICGMRGNMYQKEVKRNKKIKKKTKYSTRRR